MIVASKDDGIYYNTVTKQLCDLDETFQIRSICEVIYDEEEGHVYMLCNKHKEILGIFLIQFEAQDPE